MKVKLIQATQNPIDVMWVAARTCYSEKSPIDLWNDRYGAIEDGYEHTEEYNRQCTEGHWELVQKILESGHSSIAEHVYFTFVIEGISRACSHQLVRHRAGIVFSQQSQRYVEIKEDISNILRWEEAKPILDKYFIDVNTNNWQEYLDCLKNYSHHIQMGMKPEDARSILPNATKTNITMSINLRELIHIANLRMCTRAQKEIRDLMFSIKREVMGAEPRLAALLVPSCEALGVCQEGRSCHRKPTLKEVIKVYNSTSHE